MDVLLTKYMEKALEFEAKGCVEEAVVMYEKLLEAFPDDTGIVLAEKAKMEFRNMQDKEALLDFIRSYAVDGKEEVYRLVLEAYLEPNLESLRRQYEANQQLLREYPFYKNEFDQEQPDVSVLWMDEETICIVNQENRTFGILPHAEKIQLEQKEMSVMLVNALWLEDIWYVMEQTKQTSPFMDMEIPLYLQYDRNYWMIFAQMTDIKELIEKNRMVILVGEKSLQDYFAKSTVIFPQKVCGEGTQACYEPLLCEIQQQNIRDLETYKKENTVYYRENQSEIVRNIQSGKPRILFLTSRFTTILQYHTRDCIEAAQKIGCETELLIESDGMQRMTMLFIYKKIREFRPDLIFCIDHFRFEYTSIPKEIVWVTWAQDPLPDIMDKKTPSRLLDRDFVMSHLTTDRRFQMVGYEQTCLIDAPVPANPYIYQPYQLTQEEMDQYACDICFVCHASDADQYIQQAVRFYPEEFRDMIQAVYEGYQRFVYETGELFYNEETFAMYIRGALQQQFYCTVSNHRLKAIAYDMYMWFNQRVFRQALADWIIDAGFTSIKLWGNGWQKSEKYKKYAMGPAENGEILSKIYQASKIVIGNNVMTTAAARAWETMLSGGFYLSNYIPPEYDVVDIRKILQIGKEVEVFYNKEDLIKKITYYLHHEEERQKMIKMGRKAALERMTYDVLMQRVINDIGERLHGYEERKSKGDYDG